jgi:hypothetical protein
MPRQLVRYSLVVAFLVASLAVTAPSASAWQFTDGSGRAVDRKGHVVAVGAIEGSRLLAVKVNRKHGHEIWRFELPDAGAGAVALDPEGHVVVAGSSGPSSPGGGRITVIKLDKELCTPHQSVINGPGNGDDFAAAVTTDRENHVVVTAHGQRGSAPRSPAFAQAFSVSYIPCTSAPWKRATWFVGGSGSS